MNAQVERVLGYSSEELVGQLVEVLVPENERDDHRKHREEYVATSQPGQTGSGFPSALRKKDGTEIPVEISLNVPDIAGSPVIVMGLRDVSELLRARGDLAADLNFRSAFRHAPIGIALIDQDGKILLANDALTVLLTLVMSPDEHPDLVLLAHPTDREQLVKGFGDLSSGDVGSYRCQCRFIANDGRVVWVGLSATLATDARAPHRSLVVQFEDITERRRAAEVLEHQASHDPLTSLPNRVLFADRLRQALAHDQRSGRQTAVLYMDVDRFKNINDVFGHEVGDATLVELAGLMRSALRPSDTLARLGGDEFAVLAGDLADPCEASVVAERLRMAAASPLVIAGERVQSSVSIGIAFAREGMSVREILRAADMAMYVAKKRGKDRFAVFDQFLQVSASERLSVEQLLHDALVEDGIRVHYQPLVNVSDRQLAGVEALVRVANNDSVILPAGFIDIAEETGLIVGIGTEVLREACRQAAQWRDGLGNAAPPRIGVNLSTRQLVRSDLVDTVRGALCDSGLSPDRLDLEITETTFMEATGSVVKTMTQLRDLGVRLGVDDFGTGYASLTYLKRLPIDFVKIDSSFVRDVADDKADDAIVRSVVDLGHALGLTTIAEGVERVDQLEVLRSAGCDLAQGFLFSKAVPCEKLESILI